MREPRGCKAVRTRSAAWGWIVAGSLYSHQALPSKHARSCTAASEWQVPSPAGKAGAHSVKAAQLQMSAALLGCPSGHLQNEVPKLHGAATSQAKSHELPKSVSLEDILPAGAALQAFPGLQNQVRDVIVAAVANCPREMPVHINDPAREVAEVGVAEDQARATNNSHASVWCRSSTMWGWRFASAQLRYDISYSVPGRAVGPPPH